MLFPFFQCCSLLIWWKWKSVLLIIVICVCCFFCLHNSDRVEWVLCLISMHHSMMLLLFLQCCSLLVWWEWKIVDCWWMPFVCCLFCSYSTDLVLWVLCLISMHLSTDLHMHLQCCCLLTSIGTNPWEDFCFRLVFDVMVTRLTCKIDFFAQKDVHQKTNSFNRQFTFDSLCDTTYEWVSRTLFHTTLANPSNRRFVALSIHS